MRIIKAAKRPEEYITSCHRCHSVLGVREVDIEWINADWTFECPVCGIKNQIDQDISELFPWQLEEVEDEKISDNHIVREYSI